MHLVPFVPSESPISEECKRRGLSPFVTLIMMGGITLILLIESRGEILLMGGRL
jgi:hypothetical protein